MSTKEKLVKLINLCIEDKKFYHPNTYHSLRILPVGNGDGDTIVERLKFNVVPQPPKIVLQKRYIFVGNFILKNESHNRSYYPWNTTMKTKVDDKEKGLNLADSYRESPLVPQRIQFNFSESPSIIMELVQKPIERDLTEISKLSRIEKRKTWIGRTIEEEVGHYNCYVKEYYNHVTVKVTHGSISTEISLPEYREIYDRILALEKQTKRELEQIQIDIDTTKLDQRLIQYQKH